jgi:hypothetical protein
MFDVQRSRFLVNPSYENGQGQSFFFDWLAVFQARGGARVKLIIYFQNVVFS